MNVCNIANIRQDEIKTEEQVNAIAEKGTMVIQKAAMKCIPRKQIFAKSVPWWNREIDNLKKETNRLRREYQREADADLREQYRERYTRHRKLYTWTARELRVES